MWALASALDFFQTLGDFPFRQERSTTPLSGELLLPATSVWSVVPPAVSLLTVRFTWPLLALAGFSTVFALIVKVAKMGHNPR